MNAWDTDLAQARIAGLASMPGAILPILRSLQEEFGYIHKEAIPLVAEALNISRAEVVGVVNFYHDFKQEPTGRHILQICRAEACQSMGCESLVEHVQGRLGVNVGGTTGDGAITLEAVYCLGNCALSPAVMLDGELHGRVTTDVANRLIREARKPA